MIIDASNFLHRIANRLKIQDESQRVDFIYNYISTIREQVSIFKPGFLLIVKDSKETWRHSHPQYIHEKLAKLTNKEGYKGTRKKSSVNIKLAHRYHNEALQILQEQFNVSVLAVHNCEADDIVSIGIEELSSRGIMTVAISSDKDWVQNVHNNSLLISPLPNRKTVLYVNKALEPSNFLIDKRPYAIKDVCSKAQKRRFEVRYINPFLDVLQKIILGDDGDNIRPIDKQPYTTGNGSRKTPKKKLNELIVEKYSDRDMSSLYDEEFINDIVTDVKSLLKSDFTIEEVKKSFLNNRKMVLLNNKEIPQHLVNEIRKINWGGALEVFKYDLYKLLNFESSIEVEDKTNDVDVDISNMDFTDELPF